MLKNHYNLIIMGLCLIILMVGKSIVKKENYKGIKYNNYHNLLILEVLKHHLIRYVLLYKC